MLHKPRGVRWAAFPDIHGDMADQASLRVAREFLSFFKPEIRIQLGDLFDFRCLRKGCSNEEAYEELRDDVSAGMDVLNWMRPTHWVRGNHDERLFDGIDSHNPILREMCKLEWANIEDMLNKVGCKSITPYSKSSVLTFGYLRFVHGFSSGMYAAKKHAEVFENVVFCHTHAIDSYSIPGLSPRVGWNIGCLCELDMPYNRAHLNTLRQGHGFAYGFFYPDGTYRLFQAQEINGTWLFPTEFKEIKS